MVDEKQPESLAPLRTNAKCDRKLPRLGTSHQVPVKKFDRAQASNIPKAPRRKKYQKNDSGSVLLWMPDQASERAVDMYLEFVKSLFPNTQHDYSEERALYFLHRCDYDIRKARSLLSLKEVQGEEESESEVDHVPQNNEDEDEHCFSCGEGGTLVCCDVDGCRKVYHCHCVGLNDVPSGRWECPSHECQQHQCNNPSFYACYDCPKAYCKKHTPQDLTTQDRSEFLCKDCNAKDKSERSRFLSKFNELMKRRGEEFSRLPRIAGMDLDIHKLYKIVTRFGGASKVCDGMMWTRVRDTLKIPPSATNAASVIKQSYIKYLYPYEQVYFADSKTLDEAKHRRRGRGSGKRKRDSTAGDYCDIVLTEETKDAYKMEINIDGHIRYGMLFKNLGKKLFRLS